MLVSPWPKVAILIVYVVGALVALWLTQGSSDGKAIAYMLAGAAANQGAVIQGDHKKESR